MSVWQSITEPARFICHVGSRDGPTKGHMASTFEVSPAPF